MVSLLINTAIALRPSAVYDRPVLSSVVTYANHTEGFPKAATSDLASDGEWSAMHNSVACSHLPLSSFDPKEAAGDSLEVLVTPKQPAKG